MAEDAKVGISETAALVAAAICEKEDNALPNAAFDELVRRYQDMVYGYVYAKVFDPHLAQDIVQESFIAAYAGLDTIRNPEAFGAWIKAIAFHQCIRHRRRVSSTRETRSDLLDELRSHYDEPELMLERKEQNSEIEAAIESLPEAHRTTFILYYMNGHTHSEIAELLGITVSAVKKRVQRSRDALKKEMMYMIREHMEIALPSADPKVLKRISLAASFEQAAALGQLCLVEAMLMDGIDINEVDAKGRTLLHWAATSGHIEALQLLLRCGADPALKDLNGRTPLDCAKVEKRTTAFRLLSAREQGEE